MTIYFGLHKNGHYGFFHDTPNLRSLIPKGAVEITPEQHKELLNAPKVVVDPDGKPRAVSISLSDLTLPQQANRALAQGLQIISTSCPAVDGIYACNDSAVMNALNAAMHLKMYGVLPGARGALQLQWPDKSGAPHQFADQALFLAFSAAVSNYNALLKQVVNKTSTTLPPASETID
jgi:hypothetical protein